MSSAKLYRVDIRPPSWEGQQYTIFYDKRFGDFRGGCNEVESKAEAITFIRQLFRKREEYDSILGRMPPRVTQASLEFSIFTPDISMAELFGNHTLRSFMDTVMPRNGNNH
jgi:hypothetical protein